MSKKKPVFLLKPISLLVALGLSAPALSTVAPPSVTPPSPFSQYPLHLGQHTQVTTSTVKPNIYLGLNSYPGLARDTARDGRPRSEVIAEATLNMLNKYGDKANWVLFPSDDATVVSPGMTAGSETQRQRKKYGGMSLAAYYLEDMGKKPSEWQFGMNLDDMKNYLSTYLNFKSSIWDNYPSFTDHKKRKTLAYMVGQNGGGSTESRYLDGLFLLRNAIKYRCQKSYSIVLSDGQVSATMETNPKYWPITTNKNIHGVVESVEIEPSFQVYYPPYNTVRTYEAWLQIGSANANNGQYSYNGKSLWDFNGLGKYFKIQRYRHTSPEQFTRPSPKLTEHGFNFLIKDGHNNYQWNTPDKSKGVYMNRSPGFYKFIADAAFDEDAKTDAKDGKDAAGKSWDDPLFNNGKQNISSYYLAWPRKEQDIRDGTVIGSYIAQATGGKPYMIGSQQDLERVFDEIMANIAKDIKNSMPPQSFSSFVPAVSNKDNTTKLPDMAAAVRLILENGASEIFLYKINSKAVSDDYTTPNYRNRKVLIHDGQTVQWADRFQGSNAFFDLKSNNPNEWSTALLPWITRSKDDSAIASMTGLSMKYRNRSGEKDGPRDMGDIIGSGILAYGPFENGRKKFMVTAANDGMIYLFKSSGDANHPYDLKLNYIPAGMERESSEDTMAKHFKYIANADYIRPRPLRENVPFIPEHQYMINGGFTVRTMDDSGPQQVFMAINMGQGGRGTVALNLGGPDRKDASRQVGIDADPSTWHTSVPLFETPKGADNAKMGYTIGSPTIGRVAMERSLSDDGKADITAKLTDVRQSVFVGSGVMNPTGRKENTESALYVYNAISDLNVGVPGEDKKVKPVTSPAGQLLRKLEVPVSMGKGGLAAPTIVDIDFDGVMDIVYAGDYSGGLYRFDLRPGGPKEWTVKKIFQTANNQPITSAPAVFREEKNKYIVVFGTGSDLYQSDLEDKSTQAVYGIYDDLTNLQPEVKQVSGLTAQTFSVLENQKIGGQSFDFRQLTDNALPEGQPPKGWYFNLTPGERVVVKPNMLLKTAIIVTRNYKVTKKEISNQDPSTGKVDLCLHTESSSESSGESWIMQVKVDNGGNLPGKDGDDVYAYVDLTRQNPNGAGRSSHQGDFIFSGTKINGGGLADLLVDSSVAGNNEFATNRDGDSSGSGRDGRLTVGGREADALCLADKEHFAALSNSGGKKGVEDLFELIGLKCGGKIRRISWREIF